MLSPKRTRFHKQRRGRMKGISYRGRMILEKAFSFVCSSLSYDLNESHIHPSTCSSMLKNPRRARDFLTFLIGCLVFLISCLIVGMLNHIQNGLV